MSTWIEVEASLDPLSLAPVVPAAGAPPEHGEEPCDQFPAALLPPLRQNATPCCEPAHVTPERMAAGDECTALAQSRGEVEAVATAAPAMATAWARRVDVTPDGDCGADQGAGKLIARHDGLECSLIHCVAGRHLWPLRPGTADCRLVWLHEGIAAGARHPPSHGWLVFVGSELMPSTLLVFDHEEAAEALADVLGCVEPWWGASAAQAIDDGRRHLSISVRHLTESLVESVQRASAEWKCSAEAAQAPAQVPEEVRHAVSGACDAAQTLARTGSAVMDGIAHLSFAMGSELQRLSAEAGMLEGLDTPNARAASNVGGAGLRASVGLMSEVYDGVGQVYHASADAVAEAVAHSKGNEAAALTRDALHTGGHVAGTVMSMTPAVVVRKAVTAGVMGAAGIETSPAVGTGAITGDAAGRHHADGHAQAHAYVPTPPAFGLPASTDMDTDGAEGPPLAMLTDASGARPAGESDVAMAANGQWESGASPATAAEQTLRALGPPEPEQAREAPERHGEQPRQRGDAPPPPPAAARPTIWEECD